MAYGLRFHSISQTLGSSFSWFVPSADMPLETNERGWEVFRDENTTPTGNTFLYDKGERKRWRLDFADITTESKINIEHICRGWLKKKQITVVVFGTSVVGTSESMASMSTAGQIWGTCYINQVGIPKEAGLDLWSISIDIIEFGPDQAFS